MTWVSFTEYLALLDTPDAAMRAYDLARNNDTSIKLLRSLKLLGYNPNPSTWCIEEIRMRLASPPYHKEYTRKELKHHIQCWYVWHRLITGQIRKWPRKKGSAMVAKTIKDEVSGTTNVLVTCDKCGLTAPPASEILAAQGLNRMGWECSGGVHICPECALPETNTFNQDG